MSRAVAVLIAIAALAAGAGRARADARSEATLHMDRATVHHAQGEFAEALRELTIAYALDPRPEMLYAIGQTHVQLGQCRQAILFYERYLSTRPAPVPAAAATEAIEACRTSPGSFGVRPRAAATTAPPALLPARDPAAATPVETAPVAVTAGPRRRPAWYTDKLGGALTAGGVVLGAVAIGVYASASSDRSAADETRDYATYADLVDRAGTKRTTAVVLGAGGIVLIGAGVTRYVMHRRGGRERLALVPASGGGLLAWSGRF